MGQLLCEAKGRERSENEAGVVTSTEGTVEFCQECHGEALRSVLPVLCV